MRSNVQVGIVRVCDQQIVQADVIPATTNHLAQAQAWREHLVRKQQSDKSWDWFTFLQEARTIEQAGKGRFEAFALVIGTELQAMLLLETQARRSRMDGKPLVYVEYLSVAPHNRPTATPRMYKRCGEAMLEVALQRSRTLGYSGRMGLHTLSTSAAFYVKMGMSDFGEDPEESGLHYFELGPDVLEST